MGVAVGEDEGVGEEGVRGVAVCVAMGEDEGVGEEGVRGVAVDEGVTFISVSGLITKHVAIPCSPTLI